MAVRRRFPRSSSRCWRATPRFCPHFENNQLDWAGNFLTGLSAFTSGAGHKVWFAGVNTNSLIPNLSTWPMNQLAVRQAVSLAIDRNDDQQAGESGLEPPATNASGIVLPNFAAVWRPR